MPKYIVFGAGATGSILGAALHRSGQDVVLVGRGLHVQATIRPENTALKRFGSGCRKEGQVEVRIVANDLSVSQSTNYSIVSKDCSLGNREIGLDLARKYIVSLNKKGVEQSTPSCLGKNMEITRRTYEQRR